jgi:hypothetical protein
VNGDAGAFPGEAEGDAAADALGGSGDEDGFTGESHESDLWGRQSCLQPPFQAASRAKLGIILIFSPPLAALRLAGLRRLKGGGRQDCLPHKAACCKLRQDCLPHNFFASCGENDGV